MSGFMRRAEMAARIAAGQVLKHLRHGDTVEAKGMVRTYWFPHPPKTEEAIRRIGELEAQWPGFTCRDYLSRLGDAAGSPFVYENPDAPHLRELREKFGFDGLVAGATDEYDAMLRLGTWLGSRWDHGKDPVPGGPANLDLVRTIEAGMQGSRYWCEIAAKVAVGAFTSMGWVSRLATTSRDGYTWEHAVVEIWSNRFAKWFAMDTDFNLVYESRGVPLSVYEICHEGPALHAAGGLQVLTLGKPKPSLDHTDLLPFYAYVHVDLRSDWRTRRLAWGSPAAGDLSTWWTARPDFPRFLTPKTRMDDRGRFDWPVNMVWALFDKVEGVEAADRGYAVTADLVGYSPYFAGFQTSLDGGDWREAKGGRLELVLGAGDHSLSVRMQLSNGGQGPVRTLAFHLPRRSGADTTLRTASSESKA